MPSPTHAPGPSPDQSSRPAPCSSGSSCRQNRRGRVRRAVGVVVLVPVAVLALAGVSGCGGPDALSGTLRTSDTKGKDGAPMAGGWVAVLTADQLADFLRQSGISQPSTRGLGFVEGRVRHEAIGETGGTLVPVDDDGKFTTSVSGPRQVCVLRELPQVDLLRGCAAVDLPADGDLAITVGDDGVAATLRD